MKTRVKKKRVRFISLLLSIVMIVCTLPISAASDKTSASGEWLSENALELTQSTGTLDTEDSSVTEIVSRREENVKHFRLTDGSVQAIVYGRAVHRKDASGNWQDIDNNLSANNAKISDAYATDDLRLVFAKRFVPNQQIYSLNENGYSISMKLVVDSLTASSGTMSLDSTAENSVALITNAPMRRSQDKWDSVQEAVSIDNTSKIVYNNIRNNTDLEYVLTGNDIKENIIIKSAGGDYTYKFEISLDGLDAVLNDNGTVSLVDEVTRAEEYSMPCPYMYDANDAISNNVHYTLQTNGDNKYILSVVADKEWIESEDRVFPVVVDPTISTPELYDIYIDSLDPTANHNLSTQLYVSPNKIAFFRVIMPSLPANSVVKSASLSIPFYYASYITSGSITCGAYQILQPWDAATLTWNSANQYTNQGVSTTLISTAEFSGAIGAYYNSPKWAVFDISSIFQNWYNGTAVNNGVAIKYQSGTNGSVAIMARDDEKAWYPYFSVVYSNMNNTQYFLKSCGTTLFAQSDNNGGNFVEQRAFSGENAQRWYISFDEASGYYRIKNIATQYYLTSPNNTNDEQKILLETLSASANDRQLWNFINLSDGSYRIQCKAREGTTLVLGVGDGIGSWNGINIEQRDYTELSNGRDKWYVEKASTYAHITYSCRIFYDQTVTWAPNELAYAYNNATEKILSTFNLNFNLQTVLYNNALDFDTTCTIGRDVGCTEVCGILHSCEFIHHKGACRLLGHLVADSMHTFRFVNYTLCRYDAEFETHDEVGGIGEVGGNDCILTLPDAQGKLKLFIQHELTHNMGATHDTCDGYNCVLAGYEDTWCASCEEAIRANY